MPDLYPHPDPGYLRDLAARDPIELQRYVRGLRNAYLAALASALLRFVWRHIKPTFTTRLAKVFKRPKRVSAERYPLTPAAKALISNLMAMR